MVFDIILILIFIILITFNAIRGAAKSLANIIVIIISYIAATAFGKLLAIYTYDAIVKPAITKAVNDAVSNVSSDAASTVVSALPSWITNLLNVSGDDLTNLFKEPISGIKSTLSEAVNTAVQPVASGILTFFLTIVLFFIIMILLRLLLIKPILKLFRFPVLNAVNHVLGGVIGAIDAVLLVCMLAYLSKLVLVNIGSDSTWFNESTINNSFIFYHFYSGNIFTWVSSWISG